MNTDTLNPNPLLTRAQSAAYCGLTVRTFDRERHRAAIQPAHASGPLSRRWLKSTLDLYIHGVSLPVRRGRRAA